MATQVPKSKWQDVRYNVKEWISSRITIIRGIPEGEKSAKSPAIRFAGRDQIFGLKRKVKLSHSRTKRIDFHGAKRKVWCISDSAPEAGSAAILSLYVFNYECMHDVHSIIAVLA
jgi:hypothetical protein